MKERPVLDWRPRFDERSRRFPVRAIAPDAPRGYSWSCPVWLDQGREGACVGFGWAHRRAARPAARAGVSEADAFDLYHRAQQLDEWEGEAYEGSSVLAGAKAALERGWIVAYHWAFSEPELAAGVSRRGPAVLGLPWYEGMFEPDAAGFLRPTGQLAGGHCILDRGLSLRRGAHRVHNSWGLGWGENGEAWISRADMAALLAQDGEACLPTVR